ncbi:MAG: ATPase, T2SS/T4P/T4SS family, partial [Parcubacteria group bacterium]
MASPVRAKGSVPDIPSRDIKDIEVSGKILEYIPQDSAKHYRIVPIGVKDGVLEVGAIDPNDLEARDALNFISARIGMPYKLFLISENDFSLVLEKYKGLSGEVTKALSELESELSVTVPLEPKAEDKEKKADARIVEDAPVTKIVATILSYASEGKASDIHIEPTGENVRVRFRVDGVLNTSLVLPLKVHSAVVARIKILSNMRLDEKRKPQDGRFSARIEDRKIDFRVSTFPTYYGEKVVMRILDQSKGLLTLDGMGFSEQNLKSIRKGLERPYGLILITGPTGSGKSTTLYAMLKEVDREHRNVLS